MIEAIIAHFAEWAAAQEAVAEALGLAYPQVLAARASGYIEALYGADRADAP